MSKKIIITKKKQAKKSKPNSVKMTKPKLSIKQPIVEKITKKPIKQLKNKSPVKQPIPKITSSQKVIISKPKIKKNLIKKINKKLTNPKLKNTKIQEKQEHWFKRILKSIRN
ncbi:MAG: hypothetical protein ACQBVK_02465, partial [Candidatus Phytoplasma sp. TWB_XP]